MKKNVKRSLSVLLVLIMLLGLIPTTAFADDDPGGEALLTEVSETAKAAEEKLTDEQEAADEKEAATTKKAIFYYLDRPVTGNWVQWSTASLTDNKIVFPEAPYVRGLIPYAWRNSEEFTAGGVTYKANTFFYSDPNGNAGWDNKTSAYNFPEGLDVSDSETETFKFYAHQREWANVTVKVKAVGLEDGDTMPATTAFSLKDNTLTSRFYVGDSKELTTQKVELGQFNTVVAGKEYAVTLHTIPLTYFNSDHFKQSGGEVEGYILKDVKREYQGGLNGVSHPDYPYTITYTFTYQKIVPGTLTITKVFEGDLTDEQIAALREKAQFKITPENGEPFTVDFKDFNEVDGKWVYVYPEPLDPGRYTVEEVNDTWEVDGYLWIPDVHSFGSGEIGPIQPPVVKKKAPSIEAQEAVLNESENESAADDTETKPVPGSSTTVTIQNNGDVTVDCINTYEEIKPGTLTIVKKFEGLTDDQIAALKGSTFVIQPVDRAGNPSGDPITVVFDGSKEFSETIEVPTPGAYRVSEETGWEVENYFWGWDIKVEGAAEGDPFGPIDVEPIPDPERDEERSIGDSAEKLVRGPVAEYKGGQEEAEQPIVIPVGPFIPFEPVTEFVIDKEGNATVTFTNFYHPDPAKFGIVKLVKEIEGLPEGVTDDALKGLTFEIIGEDGEPVAFYVVTGNEDAEVLEPVMSITYEEFVDGEILLWVPAGSYTVKETNSDVTVDGNTYVTNYADDAAFEIADKSQEKDDGDPGSPKEPVKPGPGKKEYSTSDEREEEEIIVRPDPGEAIDEREPLEPETTATVKNVYSLAHTVKFDTNGGSKNPDDQTVEHEKTATEPEKPTRDGYTFKGWTLDDEDYDFNSPVTEDITLVAKWEKNPTPVDPPVLPPVEPPVLNKEDHFAYIIGYPDGEVKPNGTITRAEVVTVYFRMLTDESRDRIWSQSNSFNDVMLENWFNNAISTMENGGIINGYPDGGFHPNGNITRAEFAAMSIRFFQDAKVGPSRFSDTIGHWAEEAISKALSEGLITGYPDGTFRPDEPITRAEAMTIFNRVLERHPDKNHLLNNMIQWPDNMDTNAWYYADVQEATNSHNYEMYGAKPNQYEIWQSLLPVRDWAAFEKAWSNSHAAYNPGDVIDR